MKTPIKNPHHKAHLHLVFGLLLASLVTLAGQVRAEEAKPFDVWHEEIEGGYRFFVKNLNGGARSVQLKFTSLRNLEPTKELPLQFVMTETVEKEALVDLKIVDTKKGHGFRFESSHHVGDFRTAKHDPSAVYLMPFTHGTKHRIYQGYHGKASHFEEGHEFAVDFKMDEGTTITAARAGVVVAVKEDSNKGGWSNGYSQHSNHVHILHEDGSIAKYEHLQQDGALVELGDKIAAGQEIGLSGNTGKSSGPHLHFEVVVPTAEGKGKSLPTKFYNHLGEPVPPVAGELYYAWHPDKPKFEAVFPPPPKNEDYEQHREIVPKTGKVTSREVVVDTTTVIYLRNGFDVEKVVEVTMPGLQNLEASKTFPMTLKLEPLTEKFVVLVRHVDLEKPSRFRIGWSHE